MAFTPPEYHPPSMFLEPPAKRLCLMGAGPMANGRGGFVNANALDYDDNDDEFDELLYEPDEVTERRDPDCKLMRRRIAAGNRFQSAMADIIERFDRDFGDEGDEISFATGEVVVDRGHLTSLQIWDRSDGEEEDEGIRLEDLPDDWGEEEDAGVRHAESSPEPTAPEGQDGEARGEVTEDMAVDVTLHSGAGVPEESAQQQAHFTTGKFTVVLPRKSPRPGFASSQAHDQLLSNIWGCQPEEYDSGFGSSTSECRRSGRVRKQVDFLGKITWAEALGLDTASPWAATEPHTASTHYDTRAIDGRDEGHSVPINLGDNVPEDVGIRSPTLRPSSLSPVVVVADSQETVLPPSSSVILDNSAPTRDSHLEVADSDAESDTESDVQPDPSQRSTSVISSGSQYHDARDEISSDSGFVNDTAQPDDAVLQQENRVFESATKNQELSHDIVEKTHQHECAEIPDSQEPSSSAVQDLAITHVAQQPEISTEPEEAEDDPESCIAVDAPDSPIHLAQETEPPPAEDTPSKSNRPEPLQQVTPRPSPTKTKPATPSKRRSSPAHPHTPRHSTVNLSKPPSSRRSILSLVSDDQRDAGRRSDDETELLREDELAVTIPQLFASSRSNKRRRKLKAEIYRTPVKQRTDRLLTPLSSGKTCGQGGVKCGSDFCFTCM